MGIPTFEKKRFWLQNSDILMHIWKVVEGGDFLDSCSIRYEPFFLKGGRSENILDPSEGFGQ